MDHFELHSEYKPTGDQPQAIERLVRGFKEGNQFETLLGVTGSGKTFTMANVIAQLNKPTLILAHNKTLAAQLYGEMKEFFPENAVEYFVSYYDYYQPEAYVPSSDTYIAKDSSINDEIDKLRLSATAAMSERKDVVVISSVSCIYGLGSPQEFFDMMISLRPGMTKDRDEVIRELIDIQYTRNEMDFHRSTFRVRGDTLEIFPANSSDTAVRVEFFGDEIDRISEIDVLTGEIKCQRSHISIFPASHYVVPAEQIQRAAVAIEEELKERVEYFKSEDKLLEAQRISERTNFDIEMMKETGFCSGIENYSRHLSGLKPGQPPYTLLDYFGDDFLLIIDESHITVPQVGGMYAGDQSRKQTLVDYGFRLPSAKDNRPLSFEEFESKLDQVMFVSATPGQYEYDHELLRAEQIIRPTGLLDPKVEVRPIEGQIDDLIGEVNKEVSKKHKILITTLTKRMAEDLTEYMKEVGIRVRYLHSDIDTLERARIIRDMRLDVFDVLVGINLLREGLDPGNHPGSNPRCRQRRLPPFRNLPHPDHRTSCPKQRRPCNHVRRQHDRFHAQSHHRNQPPPNHSGSLQQRTRNYSDYYQKSSPRSHCRIQSSSRNRSPTPERPRVHDPQRTYQTYHPGRKTNARRSRRPQL